MPRLLLSVLVVTASSVLTAAVSAQAPAPIRTAIEQAVRAYVDANNQGDTAALAKLFGREADVTAIGGELRWRGRDAIHSAVDSDYRTILDSIDVIPLGPGYAMAIAGYTLTLASGRGDARLPGAMTLLFKRVDARWRIIHAHVSTAARAEVVPFDDERSPYAASMRSDLRSLIIAEENFFVDSTKYTTRIGRGGVAFTPSEGNTPPTITLTPDGWTGSIGNVHTRTRCYIFVGFTSLPPATKEGVPKCA